MIALCRLKILDWFSHCSVQIGDYMTHCIKNDDIITSIEPSKAYDPNTAFIKDIAMKVVRDSDNKKQDETIANSVSSSHTLMSMCVYKSSSYSIISMCCVYKSLSHSLITVSVVYKSSDCTLYSII